MVIVYINIIRLLFVIKSLNKLNLEICVFDIYMVY